MSETTSEPAEPSSRREITMALLLGLATLGASWSTFEGGKCGGDAQNAYTVAQTAYSAALTSSITGIQYTLADGFGMMLVDSHRMMAQEGSEPEAHRKVAQRLERKYVDENMAKALRDVDDIADADTSAYEADLAKEAEELAARGDTVLQQARYFNEKGDRFEMVALSFTLVLFFGGMAPVFRRPGVQKAMIGLSAVLLVAATVRLFLLMAEKAP